MEVVKGTRECWLMYVAHYVLCVVFTEGYGNNAGYNRHGGSNEPNNAGAAGGYRGAPQRNGIGNMNGGYCGGNQRSAPGNQRNGSGNRAGGSYNGGRNGGNTEYPPLIFTPSIFYSLSKHCWTQLTCCNFFHNFFPPITSG